MSQQQRLVQLSPASLALVFGKDDDSSSPAGGKYNGSSASGREIFADFKSQNMRSFWNKTLVKAMAEVHFQGWMENFVLTVQGNANHLEVLREAWMRRALRSARGFVIRAVGDLSPVQMAPILQSQFIPLSEVLCCVISDMNAAHSIVNQEALFSRMMKSYPGMTIPTQDILYNALGALIKERKIYHTGEGYFIVTPQTYFITNSVVKDKHWWTSAEDDPPPPTHHLPAHCKSCSCFTPQLAPPVQDHYHSISECTGKSMKPRDSKPSVQHQSTSTATDYQPSEMSKSTTSRKDKEKAGRKFGLNLFRRNVGKKEKPKKEYATFSGQFPPAEWPVRDEDDLNNLPRDLEHAIIKRINPELTVDNLVRHTVLMKKLDEKGVEKGVDRGMSTEILASRQRQHSAKVPGKRSTSKAIHSKRRVQSSREKQRLKSKALGNPTDPLVQDTPSRHRHEVAVDEPDHKDCSTVDTKNVYKKQIDNPFQGKLVRDAMQGSGHRGSKMQEERRQVVEIGERLGHRSKSWDLSRTQKSPNKAGRALTVKDQSLEGLNEKGLPLDSKPMKELLGDYSSCYPESSTLRIEDKIKKLREAKAKGRGVKDESSQDGGVGGTSDLRHTARQTKNVDLPVHPLPLQITYQYNTIAIPPSWPNPTVQHRLTLSPQPLDSKGEVNQRSDHSHQEAGSKQNTQQSSKTCLESICGSQQIDSRLMQSDSSTDEDQTLYQRSVEDDDACSSLYLNEDSMNESSEVCQSGRIPYQQSFSAEGNWDSTFIVESSGGVHQEPMLGTFQQVESRWHELSSQHHSSQSLISPSEGVPRQGSQFLQEPGGEAEPVEAVESSIFDYCQASEVESDTETLHKSADEADSKSSSWVCSPHTEESLLTQFENLETLSSPHTSSVSQSVPEGASAGETVENHSSTGDSGIDSPRTGVSLTSSNSVILVGIKRQSFLQDLEKLQSKGNGIRSQNSLLQLTPVMNIKSAIRIDFKTRRNLKVEETEAVVVPEQQE
ncbi:hypothetical protein AAFF_G00364810 [Aldrovandia affinis]|uniref:Winged helix Storkhead-box1 domain-containing protein n=1 Tax=Aldrovandia affinis TaxID=143900 RepID=A0AAD7WNS2_9TELE|nr:hypothetical protein AAFF_G00364810 [Aldrovandia affinis]